jgi:hypothetical protein
MPPEQRHLIMISHQTKDGYRQHMRIMAGGKFLAEGEQRGEKLLKHSLRQQPQTHRVTSQNLPLDQLAEIRLIMNKPARAVQKNSLLPIEISWAG